MFSFLISSILPLGIKSSTICNSRRHSTFLSTALLNSDTNNKLSVKKQTNNNVIFIDALEILYAKAINS